MLPTPHVERFAFAATNESNQGFSISPERVVIWRPRPFNPLAGNKGPVLAVGISCHQRPWGLEGEIGVNPRIGKAQARRLQGGAGAGDPLHRLCLERGSTTRLPMSPQRSAGATSALRRWRYGGGETGVPANSNLILIEILAIG